MWSIISTVAAVAVLVSMWGVGSHHLKQQGRGFFFRNWIGGVMAAFFAIVTVVLLSADAWYWNLGGLTLTGWCVYRWLAVLKSLKAEQELVS